MSDQVRIVEVGPRDGLQNEKTPVSAEARIAFVENLVKAGLDIIEVGSFVSPKAIPQMANSDQVLRAVDHHPGHEFHVLVPNEKGYEGAKAAGAKVIAVFASASEGFSKANINCTIAESIQRFVPVLERAKADGIKVRGYVSCVLGCPYDGEVKPSAVADVTKKLWDLGCYEVSLGDTIGVGTPAKARQLLRAVATEVPMQNLGMHFHDTYGQALANLYAGLEEGARVIDSAAGGLGVSLCAGRDGQCCDGRCRLHAGRHGRENRRGHGAASRRDQRHRAGSRKDTGQPRRVSAERQARCQGARVSSHFRDRPTRVVLRCRASENNKSGRCNKTSSVPNIHRRHTSQHNRIQRIASWHALHVSRLAPPLQFFRLVWRSRRRIRPGQDVQGRNEEGRHDVQRRHEERLHVKGWHEEGQHGEGRYEKRRDEEVTSSFLFLQARSSGRACRYCQL
jgi:hydroxymethylglutaryl-CoA lyase